MTTEPLVTRWRISPPSRPPHVRGMNRDTTIELMLRWWHENFQEPAAAGVPWWDGEWQWRFTWSGGPFEPRSELESTFAGAAAPNAIDAAVAELERKSDQWAPNSRREHPAR